MQKKRWFVSVGDQTDSLNSIGNLEICDSFIKVIINHIEVTEIWVYFA